MSNAGISIIAFLQIDAKAAIVAACINTKPGLQLTSQKGAVGRDRRLG